VSPIVSRMVFEMARGIDHYVVVGAVGGS
jgi:hypothetical protein